MTLLDESAAGNNGEIFKLALLEDRDRDLASALRWVLLWRRRLLSKEKFRRHSVLYTNGSRSTLFSLRLHPQTTYKEHWNGFSPVWEYMCAFKPLGLLNVLPQWGHTFKRGFSDSVIVVNWPVIPFISDVCFPAGFFLVSSSAEVVDMGQL